MNRLFACITLSAVLLSTILEVDGAATNTDEKSKPNSGKVPKIFDYGHYVEKFKKAYSPLETLSKARLFFGRTIKIFQHNILYTHSKVSYYLNQNQFTDVPSDELKKEYLNNEFLNIKPVVEAKQNPEAPASSVVGEAPQIDEVGSSKCQLSNDNDDCDEENDAETILNFFLDQDVANLKGMLADLKAKPQEAEKIASIVEIKNPALMDELSNIEEVRKNNMIEHKPVVDSNNENYDPETINSYGLFTYKEPVWNAENYAKFLLEDGGYELEPYPAPINLSGNPTEDGKSRINNLLGTVKNIFDYLVNTELDYDWYQPYDDDEEDGKGKNTKEELDEEKTPSTPAPIKYDIDWRKTGCISKPATQLSCNSCYAFTTLSLMEYFYCRQTKSLTEFSAQYIIDCGPRLKIAGCKGGKISSVGLFIKKFGLELNTMYPYVGKENQCPIPEGDEEKEKQAGYLRPEITHWQNFSEMKAWYKWLPKSPVIVGINMPSDFLAYGGGIHDGLDCRNDMVHALLLVGSGTQDGKKFWLMKNSFGEQFWGEMGFFRLSKDAPLKCFNTATVARVKFIK